MEKFKVVEKFKVGDIVRPNEKANWGPNWAKVEGIIEAVVRTSTPYTYSIQVTKVTEKGKQYLNQIILCQTGLDGFELVKRGNTELHITGDGKTVHAVLKENGKVVKRAKASCDPRDEYKFETGARLATDRVFGKEAEKKGRQPLFKKGDEVRVADPEYAITTHTHPEDFSLSYGEIVRYAYGERPQTNVPYKVLKVSKQICSGMYIYVISAAQLTPVFIVTEEGLRKFHDRH